MRFISGVFRIVIGIAFGIITGFALMPAIAAFQGRTESNASVVILLIVLLSAVMTFMAPTIRRAFGRGFLMTGVAFFALPLSMMILSGRVANDMATTAQAGSEAATAVGAGLAGVAMTGAATFIGIIAGSIFLIIGLVLALGGRREVIVVKS